MWYIYIRKYYLFIKECKFVICKFMDSKENSMRLKLKKIEKDKFVCYYVFREVNKLIL